MIGLGVTQEGRRVALVARGEGRNQKTGSFVEAGQRESGRKGVAKIAAIAKKVSKARHWVVR